MVSMAAPARNDGVYEALCGGRGGRGGDNADSVV